MEILYIIFEGDGHLKKLYFSIIILISATIMFVGCNNSNEKSTKIKAIYLVADKGGQFSKVELGTHPEIVVVSSSEEFKEEAEKYISKNGKVAIWIDKDATNLLSLDWFRKNAQKARCPVALIGYSNGGYLYDYVLGFHGVPTDWSKEDLGNGFAAYMLLRSTSTTAPNGNVSMDSEWFLNSYNDKPTATAVLAVTNKLLEGKVDELKRKVQEKKS